jgi:hypothetical protein
VQDHPDHEILFGCEDPDDPAVPIVRALIAAPPEVRARLVIHEGPRGSNPKVRNLRGLIEVRSDDPAGPHTVWLLGDGVIVRRCAVAVASGANQVLGASTSGVIAQSRRGNVDWVMGVVLVAEEVPPTQVV